MKMKTIVKRIFLFVIFISVFFLNAVDHNTTESPLDNSYENNAGLSIILYKTLANSLDTSLYGGMYIDSDGILHISSTNIYQLQSIIQQRLNKYSFYRSAIKNNIVFEEAAFSYKELWVAFDYITDNKLLSESEYNIQSASVDDINNSVTVIVSNEESISKIEEVLGNKFNCIKYVVNSSINMLH